jgi:amidase
MATWITRTNAPQRGLRVAVKDLIDVAGLPTTNGSKVIAAGAVPAAEDAGCLAGTRRAEADQEATIVGKTNMHELAFGITGINPWFGTPVNPLDPMLVPGGSSSGSAVAVSAGEADIAFGSDTGGSIRIPAACCGVVGLKTSHGRIPMVGVKPLARSLDTIGPMGATVDMTVKGMALLEPGFVPDTRPVRIVGRVRLPADPSIDEAIDRALAAAPVEVRPVDLPQWNEATIAAMTVLGSEAWQEHSRLWEAHAANLAADVAARLEASSLISRDEVAAAWEIARGWAAALGSLFATVDLLALPTLSAYPPTLENAGKLFEMRYVSPFNLAGVPALAMPVPGGHHVPPSLQLVGPRNGEARLLAAAGVIEAAAGRPKQVRSGR